MRTRLRALFLSLLLIGLLLTIVAYASVRGNNDYRIGVSTTDAKTDTSSDTSADEGNTTDAESDTSGTSSQTDTSATTDREIDNPSQPPKKGTEPPPPPPPPTSTQSDTSETSGTMTDTISSL